MYTDIVNYQIVIALLKKYNIKYLVISPGNRHTPFVRSVENDSFFHCYSIVDERSAGFFAIGLIKKLREPVVICCTSGTAASNYVSAMSEAYYSNLPLIAITSDRNNYYLYQQEEQMVPQKNLFADISKKCVTLPFVKDKNDFWACSKLVNEALLEMNHHGCGPVHINVPVENGLFDFHTEKLPNVTKIERIEKDSDKSWESKAKKLFETKKILITYGQDLPISEKKKQLTEQFAKTYQAVFMVDHLANLHGYGCINSYNATRTVYTKLVENMVPDLLICMNGNAVEIRGWLINCSGQYEFWNVLEDGRVSDPFRCLNSVFECSDEYFFERMLDFAPQAEKSSDYLKSWEELIKSVKVPEYGYSDIYAVENFIQNLPGNASLHLGNSNSVRFVQSFPIKDTIEVYCNRGVSGIDGSMSSFIGYSYLHDDLSFLLIGDLSFFYDMNALWNNYIGKNLRIMLNNNSCGEIFYLNKKQDVKTVGRHIAADNCTNAKGWAEARGFKYLKATTKEEFDDLLPEFMSATSDKPILFEVFTDKYENLKEVEKMNILNEEKSLKSKAKKVIKSLIGKK